MTKEKAANERGRQGLTGAGMRMRAPDANTSIIARNTGEAIAALSWMTSPRALAAGIARLAGAPSPSDCLGAALAIVQELRGPRNLYAFTRALDDQLADLDRRRATLIKARLLLESSIQSGAAGVSKWLQVEASKHGLDVKAVRARSDQITRLRERAGAVVPIAPMPAPADERDQQLQQDRERAEQLINGARSTSSPWKWSAVVTQLAASPSAWDLHAANLAFLQEHQDVDWSRRYAKSIGTVIARLAVQP